MDIVGPLPQSSSGKRFILVICDYATRYPEAIALRTIDAVTVAEELIKFFARMGTPGEIWDKLHLSTPPGGVPSKPIRTTPYHLQTDGLVERGSIAP